MKKNFFSYLGITLVVVFTFISCEKKDEGQMQPESKLTFAVNKEVSRESLSKVNDFFVKNFHSTKTNELNIGYDLKNIQEITTDDNQKIFLSLQENYKIEGEVNFSIAFYENDNGEIDHALFIKREVIDVNIMKINYYRPDGLLEMSMYVDSKKEICFFADKSWGQDIADCINHSYSQRGWLSVTNWIATAIAPECAIAIAAVCAIRTY
ncbi:MAG TPA: hypothetical protein PLJ52_02835 [Tenuifilaceae bacterium]|nr:hypothetical protein [Tenuifilaceae bacterium]